MFIYQYFILLILLSGIFFVIRYFILRKESVPVNLFIQALKDENNGHFEEAVISYETALYEIRKIGLHNPLKNKIIEKIKTLHGFIDYRNNFHFIRGSEINCTQRSEKYMQIV